MEGNEGIAMGDRIQISGLGERFSSHTQVQPRPRRHRAVGDTKALREKLIAAMVEVIAEGGDPRLL
jgi:hypothetical protein